MIDKLLAYQDVDAKLKDIETEISQSEERKKAAAAQKFLKTVNDTLSSLDARAGELVSKYNLTTKKYEELQEQAKEYENLEESDDLTELSYVKKRALALTDEISALYDTINALYQEISSVMKEFNTLKVKTKEAKAQYSEFVPKYNELKESKSAEIKKIQGELKKLEKEISPEELEKYKQKREEKIFPILHNIKVFGKKPHCSRCGTELPLAVYDSLKAGGIIECENCHRLLYYKEEKE